MTFDTRMTLGVMDDSGLLCYSYADKTYNRVSDPQAMQHTLPGLLEVAHRRGIDSLWITPGSFLSIAAQGMMETTFPHLEMIASKKRDGTPRFVLLWCKDRPQKRVKIAWPEYDNRWPWWALNDSSTLLRSILYLQDAMCCEIAWSPGHVGQQLMIELNEKHQDWLAPAELPDVVKDNLALDVQWKRQLTPDEQKEGMYFHLFDKNSMYSAACTSALLGEGSPEHREGQYLVSSQTFNPRTPGLWKVESRGNDNHRWVWTPELEYLLAIAPEDHDIRACITEAYIWPVSHTTLRSWGEHMWLARQALRGEKYDHFLASELAYKACKPIANQGLGWLAMESKRGDNKLYRPDWWSMVVSTAHRNMGFKIRQLNKLGMSPCYCNVDALGLISEGESLEKYQTYILNRKDALGGFKHVKSIPLTKDLIALFGDEISFRTCQNGIVTATEG